ncbi:hypothetical protein ACFLZJ_00330 [Nanoarchaeota archaeon]
MAKKRKSLQIVPIRSYDGKKNLPEYSAINRALEVEKSDNFNKYFSLSTGLNSNPDEQCLDCVEAITQMNEGDTEQILKERKNTPIGGTQ